MVNASEKEVKIYGGSAHGILDNDVMIIFRSKKMEGEVRDDLLDNQPIAVVQCDTVDETTSTCGIKKMGKYGDIQKDDYAVVGNASLKLTTDK